MKKFIIAIFTLISATSRADNICSTPPNKDSHLPVCEAPRKISVRSSIVSCYDPGLGISTWAASALDPNSIRDYNRDTCDWKADKNVASISPNLYANTGFAKGHLIAFTDASCASSAADTCVTSNCVPQPGSQNSGIWLSLEKHIRGIASLAPKKSWLIVAGPRIPTPVTWVKSGLAQPNGIWKVLINLTDGTGCGYLGAYLKPYAIQTVSVGSLGITGIKDGDPTLCGFKSTSQ